MDDADTVYIRYRSHGPEIKCTTNPACHDGLHVYLKETRQMKIVKKIDILGPNALLESGPWSHNVEDGFVNMKVIGAATLPDTSFTLFVTTTDTADTATIPIQLIPLDSEVEPEWRVVGAFQLWDESIRVLLVPVGN